MKKRSYEEVTSQATRCLRDKLLRATGTLKFYNCHWRRIQRFMETNGIDFIDARVCRDYLLQKFNDRDYATLTKGEKDTVKVITVLIEFLETGTIQSGKERIDFEGTIGQQMVNYLAHKTSQRLAKHTIDEYEQHLFRFLRYLKENKVGSINAVNQLHVINYIKSINPQTISLAHISIRSLRDFFRYLYGKEIIDVDLSSMMPKDNYKAQANIPWFPG